MSTFESIKAGYVKGPRDLPEHNFNDDNKDMTLDGQLKRALRNGEKNHSKRNRKKRRR